MKFTLKLRDLLCRKSQDSHQGIVDPPINSYVILGSCVTRDAFEDVIKPGWESWFRIKRTFSRSSLISLMSPSLNVGLSEITNITPFECRYVHEDCNKVFMHYVQSIDCNETALILDFIYEQCDLLKIDQHYLTLTDEYCRSGLSAKLKGQLIPRLDASTTRLWKENCLSFISRIRNYFPAQRVILHKAYWNEKFIEGEQIMDFPDTDLIRSHNNLLREYYAFFERAFPGIKVIDMGKKNYLSDKNHRWGLKPFHYEAGYYCDFLDKLFVLSGKA